MNIKLPNNFIEEFYSRTLLFSKYSVGSEKDLEYFTRLESREVAITGSKEMLQSFNGQHMLFMIANLLSRFCLSIDLILPPDIETTIKFPFSVEDDLLVCLEGLCKKINPCLNLGKGYKQKRYDLVIAIGSCERDLGRTIFINSDGWIAYVSTQGNPLGWVSNNPNPIGAMTAACIGTAEFFKAIFSTFEGSNPYNTIAEGSIVFSTFDYGFKTSPMINPQLPTSLSIDTLHLISLGAINSATLYTLCAIPGIEGNLVLVEPQHLEISNLNRYLLTTAEDAILQKSKIEVAKRFVDNYLGVESAFPVEYQDLKKIRDAFGMDLTVIGVDNNESRWEIQKDLPRVLLCGGTEVSEVQISRHDRISEKACLGCLYPRAMESPKFIPTISFVSAFSGVLLTAEIMKEKVEDFRDFCLNNVLNIDTLNISHYQARQLEKSPKCACHCGKFTY